MIFYFSSYLYQASGVISGVQTVENGPIQWSRELPHSCLLSQGETPSPQNLIPLFVTNLLSNICSPVSPTRYQETSHTNPGRPPWSQPPEDVDLWEIFQRGKIATLYWSSCQHDHTVLRWQTCLERRRFMCTTWTSWANCESIWIAPRYLYQS